MPSFKHVNNKHRHYSGTCKLFNEPMGQRIWIRFGSIETIYQRWDYQSHKTPRDLRSMSIALEMEKFKIRILLEVIDDVIIDYSDTNNFISRY